jgi:ATP-dependent DNA helicase RecG
MMIEDKNKDYKSLRKAIGDKARLRELAETCVCFANAQGGEIIVGIEDKDVDPPVNQHIKQENVNNVVKNLRGLTDGVGIVNPEIIQHANGSEYFILRILPSTRTIATTTSGKVLIRISDNCFSVGSEELTDLAAEKTAFQWEIVVSQKIRLIEADRSKIDLLLNNLKLSDKVSDFIKQKEELEILEFYQLLSPEGYLTNLGVLWLGKPAQIARLSYPITIQYIVYNEFDEKIRKKDWHFHLDNPKEILLKLEAEAVELTYSTELPDGLFRKNVLQYPKEVIRELLINAIAHKKYTISGDIFIEVYTNRVKITSPGGFPLGITADNILHERQRRNPHLIQLLSDLKLMEGEGSGYDLVFEKLARDAKPLPKIDNDYTKVAVTVYSGTINKDAVSILDYIDKHFRLTQKEYITLGVVATEKKILSTQLASKLQLKQEDKMSVWVGSLIDKNILITQGIKKGTAYLLNPSLFSQAKLDIKPSLKTLEPYKIEALIVEDLRYNGKSKMTEIQNRLKEVPEDDIKKTVYKLSRDGDILKEGVPKKRYYYVIQKKVNEK